MLLKLDFDENTFLSKENSDADFYIVSDQNIIHDTSQFNIFQGATLFKDGVTIEASSGIPGNAPKDTATLWLDSGTGLPTFTTVDSTGTLKTQPAITEFVRYHTDIPTQKVHFDPGANILTITVPDGSYTVTFRGRLHTTDNVPKNWTALVKWSNSQVSESQEIPLNSDFFDIQFTLISVGDTTIKCNVYSDGNYTLYKTALIVKN